MICIGPTKEVFNFDRAGLAYQSDRFYHALYSPPRYELHLEEEDPSIFQLLIRWINIRSVDSSPEYYRLEDDITRLIRLLLMAEKYEIRDLPEHCYKLLVLGLLKATEPILYFASDQILELWELAPESSIRFLPLAYLLSLRDGEELRTLSQSLCDDNPLLSRDVAKLTLLFLRGEVALTLDWFEGLKSTTLHQFYLSIEEA